MTVSAVYQVDCLLRPWPLWRGAGLGGMDGLGEWPSDTSTINSESISSSRRLSKSAAVSLWCCNGIQANSKRLNLIFLICRKKTLDKNASKVASNKPAVFQGKKVL